MIDEIRKIQLILTSECFNENEYFCENIWCDDNFFIFGGERVRFDSMGDFTSVIVESYPGFRIKVEGYCFLGSKDDFVLKCKREVSKIIKLIRDNEKKAFDLFLSAPKKKGGAFVRN